MKSIDIVVPELARYDATSVHTRGLRDLLISAGYSSSIVIERVVSRGLRDNIVGRADEVVMLENWRANADLTILQHAIGSMAADEIVRREVEVIVNYHNVTPSEYFDIWGQIDGLKWGREQLSQLVPLTRLGIADSHFNAIDLRDAGMEVVEVAPVLIDDAVLPSEGDLRSAAEIKQRANHGGVGSKVTLLFVGRLVPNKCQQDLIATLAVLRRWCPAVELVLVGSATPDSYETALKEFAVQLGVGDSVRFVGSASLSELVSWYRHADVFVCLSEHEGFCVPLVEAMAWGVPVVAAAAAAVPETLGGAGVLLSDKSPLTVAVAIERVLRDSELRDELVSRGLVRAKQLGPASARRRLSELLVPSLEAV